MNFMKDQCPVTNNAKALIMTGKRSSNNCYLWSPVDSEHVCHLSKHDEISLWHKHLGHVSLNLIQKALSKDVVMGLPPIRGSEKLICGGCQAGKQIKVFHKRVPKATTRVLELIHIDLLGTM